MLNDDDVAFGAREAPDGAGGAETLLDIQIRRRLVEHENVGVLDADYGAGETLKVGGGGGGGGKCIFGVEYKYSRFE